MTKPTYSTNLAALYKASSKSLTLYAAKISDNFHEKASSGSMDSTSPIKTLALSGTSIPAN